MIETNRLILRPLSLNDADRIEKFVSDYDIAKTTLNIPHPYPKGSATQFIQFLFEMEQEGKVKSFAIVKKEINNLIGMIDININARHRHGELGYWIGKQYWGKGYGTEAARAVIEFGFNELDLNKIIARAFAENPGSWRIMEKLGMEYEGKHRQHVIRFDQFIDIVSYGLLREEYKG